MSSGHFLALWQVTYSQIKKMGAGVSLSFPRKGIPGDGILLFVASVHLTREHVYSGSLVEFSSADLPVGSPHSADLHGLKPFIFGPRLFVGYQKTGFPFSIKGEAVDGGFLQSGFRYPKNRIRPM